MLQVNLQPWRKQRQRQLLCQTLGALLLYSVINIMMIAVFSSRINVKNSQNATRIAEIEAYQISLTAATKQSEQNRQKLNLYTAEVERLKALKRQNRETIELLFFAIDSLPAPVWLEKVSVHKQTMIVNGSAIDYRSIIDFTQQIGKSTSLAQLRLIKVEQKQAVFYSTPVTLFAFSLEAAWH